MLQKCCRYLSRIGATLPSHMGHAALTDAARFGASLSSSGASPYAADASSNPAQVLS